VSEPIEYLRIFEGELLPDISVYAPFRAVIVIDAPYSPEWQGDVSKWLVAGGCLYMMAWGKDCSSWDDSVDYANLDVFAYEEIPDDRFVFTTWHEREALIDVFWFAQFSAEHPDVLLTSSLIVHVGSTSRREEFLRLWAAAPSAV
jgi:hypothetical protein